MRATRSTSSTSGTDTWTVTTEPLDAHPSRRWWQRWMWNAYRPTQHRYVGSRISSGMGYALTPGGAVRAARRYVTGEMRRAERWGKRLARSVREAR